MRYYALATDYDGTLAHDGVVHPRTLDAVRRLQASGRKLLLVTGRLLEDLLNVFPEANEFDMIVAENGALLYHPHSRERTALIDPPPPGFAEELTRRGVTPLEIGHVIVATLEPWKEVVLESIARLGLELQIIFNKGSIMVLPTGVTKASGLDPALRRLGLSRHNIAGIGDAENDHAFLTLCECAVAVANALPALKDRADLVTAGDHGDGVTELIGRLLDDDLRSLDSRLSRYDILLGETANGEVKVSPYGPNLLVAGGSGGGKSNLTTGFMERLASAGYQFCALDPEGDYQSFEGALVLGNGDRAPAIGEIEKILSEGSSLIINLIAVTLEERPHYFECLLPRLTELRAKTGRPHWIVIDEAHHLAPAGGEATAFVTPQEIYSLLLVTMNPKSVAPPLLSRVERVIAVGDAPHETIDEFAAAVGEARPSLPPVELNPGEALDWRRSAPHRADHFRVAPCHTERTRHSRKYAEGELPPDRSFYFRGPEGKLNLRAANLITFVQMMEGVDDETFGYHLGRGDYSTWFRHNIKNDDLADEAEPVERGNGDPKTSRERIRKLIEERYTLPA